MKITRWIVLIGMLVLTSSRTIAGERKPGEFPAETVRVAGVPREYRLVVPKTVNLEQPAPLVIAFHGMAIDSKDFMPRYTRLNATAEKYSFFLAYPNAVNRSWGLNPQKVKEDLAFFDSLLHELTSAYKIDPDRIYVLGMSNGGYFAHVVARERSKTIAAAASHSGPMGLETVLGIGAQRKFPVLIIHGDQDRLLPVEWARENRDKYRREGHEVKYVELAGMGHVWGTRVNINEIIWKFFADHPLK